MGIRTIIFRGKRVDNGEWVYGVPTKDEHGEMVVIESIFECDEYACRGAKCLYVDETTVGQFTGLTDNNGNKIFEGDIVKYSDEEYYCPEECTEFIGEIVFEKGAFGIGCRKELPIDLEYWCDNDNFVSLWELYWNLNCAQCELPMIEVIGNIHDNSELLEVEE